MYVVKYLFRFLICLLIFILKIYIFDECCKNKLSNCFYVYDVVSN